jgi:hypothetical protein
MQGIASTSGPVTSTAPKWKAEEPWWIRRLAAKLVHALQGVDPYKPIPPKVTAQVLEIMPAPLTGRCAARLAKGEPARELGPARRWAVAVSAGCAGARHEPALPC